MATGGEVHGQHPGSAGSEDLHQLKCQPCLEDGDLQEAVGMCVDCQDYLCLKCYQGHTLPKPCRHHQLLDREKMMQSQIRLSPKDVCTEKCSQHDDEVIKYYCISHCQLGCSVCVTLDHTTCKNVQYIPQVAKDLANSEEFKQAERQLNSALKTFQTVSENTERVSNECFTNCNETLKKIKEHRKKVDKALDNIEAALVEQAHALKSANIQELKAIKDKYKIAHAEIEASIKRKETLETASQYCSSYIEMMRTKDNLKSLDPQIKEAEMHTSYKQRAVRFTPNLDILDTLKSLESFGTVSLSSIGTIVSVKHVKDINVKSKTDNKTCSIKGLVIMSDGRLVLADNENKTVKTMHVENGQILSQLTLSSQPWDVTSISKNKVAVTMPEENKVSTLTVGADSLSIDNTFNVNGKCYGVDCRNDKLAVSFINPHKVQVLNLQGNVLYDICADKQGKTLFNYPYNLTYGQDDTTLYVSSLWSDTVVCVKLDGTVVATYTDTDLRGPRTPVVDSSGNVYVCAENSYTVHQISKDFKKLRVLLTKDDGLRYPYSLCLNKEEDKLYVTSSDCVKVYERVE